MINLVVASVARPRECKSRLYPGNGDIGIQGNNILKGNIGQGYCAGRVRPSLWFKLDL